MTKKEAEQIIEALQDFGATEEEIVATLYGMFTEDKYTLKELKKMLELIGYELTEEFLKMSPEDKKIKGWANEEEYDVLDNHNNENLTEEQYLHFIYLVQEWKNKETPPKPIEEITKERLDYKELIYNLKSEEYSDTQILMGLVKTYFDEIINFANLKRLLKKLEIEITKDQKTLTEKELINYTLELLKDLNERKKFSKKASPLSPTGRFHGDEDLNSKKKAFPKQAKYETFIRDKINVGDLFVAKYNEDALLLRVKKKGHRYDPYFFFEIEDLGKYAEKILTEEAALATLNCSEQKDLINLSKNVHYNSIFKALNKRGYLFEGHIRLYPEYGLFNQVMFQNRLIKIPNIINTHDFNIGRREIGFFEPFFQCHSVDEKDENSIALVNEGMIYFRKVEDNAISIFRTIKMNHKLIVKALDLKCGYLSPYRILENIDFTYTNKEGYSYPFKDLFKFISKKLCVADRTTNARIITNEFSDFYQQRQEVIYKGFSPIELREILDKYFILDVTQGYYYSHDTIIDKGDYFILYDKKWLKIFYDYIKKNKDKKNIDKMSDIIPYKRLEDFFKIYTFNQDDFPRYYNMVIQSLSFEDFCKTIETVQ